MPVVCPVCGAPTHREPGVAMRYCTNAACPAQLKQRVHHFVSRNAMDIAGLGEKLTDRFVELGWIGDVADLYFLDWSRVADLERLGEKSADNLRAAVERSKQRSLPRLVFALGIRHIGERSAALLAHRFGSIDALMAATLGEINGVAGIGPVLAQSVYDFFAEPRNRRVIDKLKAAGVRTAEESGSGGRNGAGSLLGKTIVVTGRLRTMTRPQAEERLRRAGANVAGTVSKKTTFVVAGEDAGSKADRARELKVPESDEDQLLAMLNNEPGAVLDGTAPGFVLVGAPVTVNPGSQSGERAEEGRA